MFSLYTYLFTKEVTCGPHFRHILIEQLLKIETRSPSFNYHVSSCGVKLTILSISMFNETLLS